MATTFVLYTPIEERAGLRSGGLISIKTGRLSSAYLAFASEALAQEFCARSKLPANTLILDARRLGPEFPVSPMLPAAMRFPDQQALESYFDAPEKFSCEQHLVSLEAGHAA